MPEETVVPVEETAQEVKEEIKEETKTEEVVETKEEVVETPAFEQPRKKSAQERIDELTRKRRDAERDAEYWKAKALQKETPVPETPVTPPIPKRPTLDQFETTEQYEDALFAWRDQKKEIETRAQRQEEERTNALRTFNERAAKVRAEHEDFDDIANTIPLTVAMRDALALNENGPELVYYLGTNEAENARIQRLPVIQQLVELGKLETKLLLAKQTKKEPSAPKPITPVGTGGTAKELDPSEMTIEQWMAWDRQREKEKLKKKYG